MADSDFAYKLIEVNIEDEMRQSYMDYAMSVIVGRALPDVRDGLKPVHRRVLFNMGEAGFDWNKKKCRSAKVVGQVVGNYHPHGDAAVYDTIVRMAQNFSLRYPLIDGQGNFGSIDGDPPAAMRYTEVRLARIAHELLNDIDKETVDFVPNYDGTLQEPVVLPAEFPSLLVNGASGIAVGMATNIPPHNLAETVEAAQALIDNPELSIEELMRYIPGPDFPTYGIINGTAGILDGYRTGRGRLLVRARTHVEEDSSSSPNIVITELPYQVNKAGLLRKIASLVKEKKITGIRGLRDETDKDGLRVVIELRRGEVPDVILNNLYQHTAIQSAFGINMVALDGGRPRLMNLKELLQAFLRHRREVITRRVLYELRKARDRAHILEGLAVALSNVDSIIELIKAARDPAEARRELLARAWQPGIVLDMLNRAGEDATRPPDLEEDRGLHEDGYRLSPTQAQSILELRLQRLTGLEQEKIVKEYGELLERIRDLDDVLAKPQRQLDIIRTELQAIRERYDDKRRTEIVAEEKSLRMEDLINEEDVVVTLSHLGYAKSQPISDYRKQHRGGRGRAAAKVKEEDFIDKLFIASTHDVLLCFSSRGRVYWLKVYELPQAGPGARGKPIVNLLPLAEDERINAVLPVRNYDASRYVVMATADGTIKKIALSAFSRSRSSGIIAINLADGNRLVKVEITDGDREIMLFSDGGRAVRFHESAIRATGRLSRGVRGIRLPEGNRLIAMVIVELGTEVLIATENGYGKRTPVERYQAKNRGIRGVIAIRTGKHNGKAVGAVAAREEDEIMLISDRGQLVRTAVKGISVQGRATQGVRLIRLSSGELLAGMERIVEEREEAEENGDGEDTPDTESPTDR